MCSQSGADTLHFAEALKMCAVYIIGQYLCLNAVFVMNLLALVKGLSPQRVHSGL